MKKMIGKTCDNRQSEGKKNTNGERKKRKNIHKTIESIFFAT